jgi:hypothetical protein
VLNLRVANGVTHLDVTVHITTTGQQFRARLNARTIRRVQQTLRVAPLDPVALTLRGRLGSGGQLEEVGLAAQPKSPKPVAAP